MLAGVLYPCDDMLRFLMWFRGYLNIVINSSGAIFTTAFVIIIIFSQVGNFIKSKEDRPPG